MTSTRHSVPLAARTVARLGADGAGRPDRIVHALDGLCEPVDPAAITATADRLWSACHDELGALAETADFLLGLDAGGIGPAVALALASGVPFKIAWKLHLDLPSGIHFTEPHNRRPDMYAYHIAVGQKILIVDDEISTGQTLANLVCALRAAGADPIGAACLIEDPRRGGRRLLEDLGLPLVSLSILDQPHPLRDP